MIDLVRKRHEGDGWIVFTELANRPGFHVKRFADAFALGVWASTKYEGHLYEFKASRGDLRREIMDPTKVEGVGKYASFWWLVLEDEKIMADLVVPNAWGIIVPEVRGGTRIAKVLRKAPRHKAQKPDQLFAISMIRNMAKNWVSHADHQKVCTQLDDALAMRDLQKPPGLEEKEEEIHKLKRELGELRDGIAHFKEVTGVDLTDARGWQYRNIGHTMVMADKLDREIASGQLGGYVSKLSTFAETLENDAKTLARSAIELRTLLHGEPGEHAETCSRRGKHQWSGRCNCGLVPMSEVERKLAADVRRSGTTEAPSTPSNRDDGQAGGGDSGDARPPEQDAGVQLRD